MPTPPSPLFQWLATPRCSTALSQRTAWRPSAVQYNNLQTKINHFLEDFLAAIVKPDLARKSCSSRQPNNGMQQPLSSVSDCTIILCIKSHASHSFRAGSLSRGL